MAVSYYSLVLPISILFATTTTLLILWQTLSKGLKRALVSK